MEAYLNIVKTIVDTANTPEARNKAVEDLLNVFDVSL
jgi:hypothetical protein